MDDHGDTPPNSDESYRTIEDDIWYLEEYTTDAWSVTDASYPETGHGGQVCLKAQLNHDTGHEIVCTPIDPWDDSPGPKLLRSHRIRLEDAVRETSTYYAFDEVPHRLTVREQVYIQPAGKVEATDELVGKGFYGKGTTAKSLSKARACVIAAARSISLRFQQRGQWFGSSDESAATESDASV